ncbi:MAG: hypothetical protein ACLFUV_09460 [Methanomassiliicoccales archaeon]
MAEEEVGGLREDILAKWRPFQEYVMGLFPEASFHLIDSNGGGDELNGRMESALRPDLHYRHEDSGESFWVKCRYRTGDPSDRVIWCEEWQLGAYQEFQKRVWPEGIFVVIGTGGAPKDPAELYCVPLDRLHRPDPDKEWMSGYKRIPGQEFMFHTGWLI